MFCPGVPGVLGESAGLLFLLSLPGASRLTSDLFCCSQGHLDTYRFCDDVWTFLIKDVSFKLDNQAGVTADKVKIVSCNSKRPGET